jgi:DNA replication and repair protein RecF
VNGVLTTAAEFVGALNVVAFAAEDIELVTGSPGVRRRYLDILISQGDPAYLRTLQRYQRVVTQRNHLLRRVRERRSAEEELRFWDDRLAEEGAAIVERRHAAVERLAEHVEQVHRALTGGGDSLGITYRPRLGPGQPPESYQLHQIADTLSQSIAALRERELSQGASIVGPHRDEFEITLGGFTAGTFASRGQSRTIALTLKLAEAEFVSNATGRKPVLALDDVLSELDAERRLFVMETVADYDQVLLTTTDLDRVDAGFLAAADRWTVAGGTASPVAA